MRAALIAAAACAAARVLAQQQPTQCAYETTAGCSVPTGSNWTPRYDMASSTYMYCFGTCQLDWLANNTQLGVWSGVVGVDHYWTKQGMPCINGIPQEFEAQNNFTIATKKVFPRARVLQYRITSAVPYAKVVHDAMLAHPEYFISWSNGTMCLMPYEEHGTTGQGCAWPIKAAAYNWALPDTQTWWLENVLQPVMTYADGAWIDGDGPDNGAWMCSGSYDYPNLPAPYPPLNTSGIDDFCTGEVAVTTAAQKWLIANNGFDYNCILYVSGNSLPNATDSPAQCAAKLASTAQLQHAGLISLWGDRTNSHYTDAIAMQAVTFFMVVRGDNWLMNFISNSNTPNATTAALLLSDYGAPSGPYTQPKPYLFQRDYAGATITFDCNTFTGSITPK